MEIRQAKVEDIDDILRLLTEVGNVHHKIRPDLFNADTTKYTKEELKEMIDNNHIIFLAIEDHKVLGYLFGEIEHYGNQILVERKTFYIDDLCVDERVRGKQVGKKLYEYTLHYAKEIGCYNVTLYVWEGNDSAIGFYKYLGMNVQKTKMEQIL